MAKRKKKMEIITILLFLLPSLVGFSIFYIIPFFGGMYYSFVDSPIGGSFVGLNNYSELLQNESFIKASLNTAYFTAISVPLNLVLSLGLALMLNRNIRGKQYFRTIFVTPLVIPVASVVFIWQSTFDINGLINGVLSGMGHGVIDWMKTDYARVVVIIVNLWKNIGYSVILMLAGLQAIPIEYYESASIDGATEFEKFYKITLIFLTPTLFFTFIMSIINSFKVFREIYLLAGQYPQDSIYMLQHFINNMFKSLDYQKLTTAAVLMTIVIVILVSILFKVERKISKAISGQ